MRLKWLAALVLLLVASCGIEADPARVDQADRAYRHLAEGQADALIAESYPGSFDPATSPGQIETLRTYVPPGPIPEPKPVQWSSMTSTAGDFYVVVQEYDYPGHVARLSTEMGRTGTRWAITQLHLQVATDAELAPVQAIVTGKSPVQLILLGLGVVILALCIFTPVVALWRWRWLWAIFSAVGVGAFKINWLTSEAFYSLLNVQILGVGFAKGGSMFDPWILTLSFPLGAVLFWTLGKWRPRQSKPAREGRRPGEFA